MEKTIHVRDSYWDNLKGILIILVVCGHLCERYIDDSNLLYHLWIIVYSFHMPLFIFCERLFRKKIIKAGGEKKSEDAEVLPAYAGAVRDR